jgi:hypothetical protein
LKNYEISKKTNNSNETPPKEQMEDGLVTI